MAPTKKGPKLSRAERKEELAMWCELNSQPKVEFKHPKVDRGKKARLKALLPRILVLSVIPKRKRFNTKDEIDWEKILTIKPATLKYKITKHVDTLALPSARKLKIEKEDYTSCFEVKPKALKYRASKRVKVLSTPLPRKKYINPKLSRYTNWDLLIQVKPKALKYKATERTINLNKKVPKRYVYKKPKKPNPTGVKKAALKGTASPRVTEIAKHKEREDTTTKKDPFNVSKAALKGTASARTTELAKPKSITPKYVAPT